MRSALALALAMIVCRAGSAVGQPRTAASDVSTLVAALVSSPPRDLETLERQIGRLRREPRREGYELERARLSTIVAKVQVRFLIDFYHESADEVLNPNLESYRLELAGDLAAGLETAGRHSGAALTLDDHGVKVHRVGDFYLRSGAEAGQFQVAWYVTEPEFAIPKRTAEETAALSRHVVRLLEEGISRESVVSGFGPFRKGESRGSERADGGTWKAWLSLGDDGRIHAFGVVFLRPLPAGAIIAALRRMGWSQLMIISGDVHQSSTEIWDPEVAYGFRVRGGYRVSIDVERKGLKELPRTQSPYPAWSPVGAQITGISFNAAND